jgi:hypothetical protein
MEKAAQQGHLLSMWTLYELYDNHYKNQIYDIKSNHFQNMFIGLKKHLI